MQPQADGFTHSAVWYSTDEPNISSPDGQDNPQPMSYFQTNDSGATIIQIAVDNGNSSSGTVPYASEEFSVDNLLVGFGGAFTRYDLGG